METQTIEIIFQAGEQIQKNKILNQILKSKLSIPEGSLAFTILEYMEIKFKEEEVE
jgi:hypothetical protein